MIENIIDLESNKLILYIYIYETYMYETIKKLIIECVLIYT